MRKILSIIAILLLAQSAFSQCYPDRHNTSWYDGWISCEAAINPNPDREYSHWIMYDLGQQYQLGQFHVWNANDPHHLDFGIKDIVIDYSVDAISWTELGFFELESGMGKNIYEGTDVVDFEMAKAKYILITAESNYGGDCFGLAEVRFELDSSASFIDDLTNEINSCLQVVVYPNPFLENVQVKIESNCNEDIYYTVTDGYGKIVIQKQKLPINMNSTIELNATLWRPGIYFLIIDKEGERQQYKLVKTGN